MITQLTLLKWSVMVDSKLRIVCVDDEEDDVELIKIVLARGGVEVNVLRVDTEAAFLHCLSGRPDLLLCDYNMPAFSAERALAVLSEERLSVPLIVVTRAISESAVVNLFRCGAKDYVTKEKLAMLPAVIDRVLRDRARRQEIVTAAAALHHANVRLRLLSSHLVDAQERERTRIARELHDGLGQILTSIVIQLRAAEHHLEIRQSQHCSSKALEFALQAIGQVKSLSFQLRPAQLELLGFVAAIKATLDRQRDSTSLQCLIRVRGVSPTAVHPSHGVALRILQEALNNVIKHASATRLVVRVNFLTGGNFTLTIADDGCGFDLQAMLEGGISERNIGLYGMIERAELMGGELRFRSTRGRGSVLRLRI